MAYRILSWSLIVFACFYGLGAFPLLDHSEGMYAAMARDMLKSGDFIIPHLNGVPYIEKPPLLCWLMAASMALFGEYEWSARLIPALALFATAWKMHRFLIRVTGEKTTGTMAALMLTTSLPLLALGRMILCDMLLTFFLSTALIFFYEWFAGLHAPGKGQRYVMGFYACLALAVLTKGFVALILAGGAITIFLLWQRQPLTTYIKIISPLGILLFLIIAAPWHIAATLQEPGFAYFYFINEHVLRFLNMREPHDYYTGHAWYYLPRVLGYLVPWTLFILLLPPPLRGRGEIYRFLWSWFLFFLIFFSAAGGKANYYMIAGMPPLILLLALSMKHRLETDPRLVRGIASISLILVVGILGGVPHFCIEKYGDFFPTCQVVSWPVIGLAVLYAVIGITICWRAPRWAVPVLGANVLFFLPILIAGVNMSGEHSSQKPVAEFLNASYDEVAIYREFEEYSALAFYLKKPLLIVDSISSDLLYGEHHAPGNHFVSLENWLHTSLPMVVSNKRVEWVLAIDSRLCVRHKFDVLSVIQVCTHE